MIQHRIDFQMCRNLIFNRCPISLPALTMPSVHRDGMCTAFMVRCSLPIRISQTGSKDCLTTYCDIYPGVQQLSLCVRLPRRCSSLQSVARIIFATSLAVLIGLAASHCCSSSCMRALFTSCCLDYTWRCAFALAAARAIAAYVEKRCNLR